MASQSMDLNNHVLYISTRVGAAEFSLKYSTYFSFPLAHRISCHIWTILGPSSISIFRVELILNNQTTREEKKRQEQIPQ
jgi:hypothetical protein